MHSVRPETNSEEKGNMPVTEGIGEEETDDIHEDCIAEEEFELDTC